MNPFLFCLLLLPGLNGAGAATETVPLPDSIVDLGIQDRNALFTYVHTDFETEMDPPREGELSLQRALRFPSPVHSPHHENNTVHCVLIEPKGATKATLVILPIWGNSDTRLEEIIGRSLAAKGYRSLILSMAYQHKRTPDGSRSGGLTVSADLSRTGWAIHQSVVDVRRAAYWLTHERNVTPDRLGIMGISLGSFVASLSYCAERKFQAAALLLGGGNPAHVLLTESRETEKIARELRREGWTKERLKGALEPFSPETYATASLGNRVLMVNAAYDSIIPYESTRSLHLAYGEPELLWIPASHYSGLFFLSDLIDRIDEHFHQQLVDSLPGSR